MNERGARRDSREQLDKERRGGVEYRPRLEPAEVHNDEREGRGCEGERNRRRSGERERRPRRGQQGDCDTVRHQRPELYVATHHAIARALDTVVPGARSHSVDELAAELAPSDEPEAILEQVKAAIAETLGPVITVSCGVAPNAFLAKTAAEANKPNAAIVWRARDIPEVYETLELADLPGLGPATEARLRARDIDTVTALYAGRDGAQWAWGSIVGRYVHAALHGHDEPPPERPRRRLSHGRTLEPRLRTWAKARLYRALPRRLHRAPVPARRGGGEEARARGPHRTPTRPRRNHADRPDE